MHWHILDSARRAILPKLGVCQQEGFYLAGGTALALQIGHRDSIDFDFFRHEPFDTAALFRILEQTLEGSSLQKVQEERNTLTVQAQESIKLSFMSYPYPLVQPMVHTEYFDLAGIGDIGCMKLSAITGRAAMKDYVDLYFILQQIPLPELLDLCAIKLPNLDRMLILKSLVFFEDIPEEPILFTEAGHTNLDQVKRFLIEAVNALY